MNSQLIVSLLELSVSLVLGIFVLFITYYVLSKIYLSKFPKENIYKNNAFLLFMAGMMFSNGYLISGVIEPLSSTLDLLLDKRPDTLDLVMSYSKYLGLFMGIGLLLGGVILYLSYLIFSSLTVSVNEFDEINNGNVGVAIIVSVIAIIISIYCKEPFLIFLESFIPYPELPRLF